MDPEFYKNLITSRGLRYYYFYTPPGDSSLPVLLFLHGFPTTSKIWKHQVDFFREHGFGLLVPDMIGFGGTDKPTDPETYRPSLVCKDIIDILDAEHLQNSVIAIGHDLGSKIVSRLANFYDERFLGYAFLAVPYCPPRPMSTMEYTLYATKRMCGYELCGHILFFAEESSEAVIEKHMDSFHNAMFPYDPKMWVTHVAPIGALKAWLETDQKTPTPTYITEKDIEDWHETFREHGFAAPVCWYKTVVLGINADDDKSVPLEKYPISKPVFFGAASHDYISRSVLGIASTNHQCKSAFIREFVTGHWLMLSMPTEVNRALFSWIMDIT
ncbi:Alpha/Beta hydrolase protein [Infundibulicybe gibba]|nr:Alpha/Beta hydrolase protein [Infundibulicybe gibba]